MILFCGSKNHDKICCKSAKKRSKPSQIWPVRVKSRVEFISGTFSTIGASIRQKFRIFCLKNASILYDVSDFFAIFKGRVRVNAMTIFCETPPNYNTYSEILLTFFS